MQPLSMHFGQFLSHFSTFGIKTSCFLLKGPHLVGVIAGTGGKNATMGN
jgi:hypothetical protein